MGATDAFGLRPSAAPATEAAGPESTIDDVLVPGGLLVDDASQVDIGFSFGGGGVTTFVVISTFRLISFDQGVTVTGRRPAMKPPTTRHPAPVTPRHPARWFLERWPPPRSTRSTAGDRAILVTPRISTAPQRTFIIKWGNAGSRSMTRPESQPVQLDRGLIRLGTAPGRQEHHRSPFGDTRP
ncbi:MAG: hypothetical protein H7A49_11815 [Akkermansiaceae bacterium]|nr:hypothetical protein [Akkermansiaceae bacterium]